jgi:hypothetical protein
LDSLDNKTLKWEEKNKETKKEEHKQREKEEIQLRTYENKGEKYDQKLQYFSPWNLGVLQKSKNLQEKPSEVQSSSKTDYGIRKHQHFISILEVGEIRDVVKKTDHLQSFLLGVA